MSRRERDRESRNEGLTRYEEALSVGTETREAGTVRARKRTETQRVSESVPREREQAEVEHLAARDGDSGEVETLPDGSVSIPLFEEQLVVTKRLVVRERVIIRKHTTTQIETVDAELRREQIEIEADEDIQREPTGAA